MPRSACLIASLAVICTCSTSAISQAAPPPSWLYSTYFGGSGFDAISATARDREGNIYVGGTTQSADFPTTPGVFEPTYPGPSGYSVVFVSKFSAQGALLWSTFLGPGTIQFSVTSGLAVDASENVYVTGIFQDTGFPTTAGLPNNGAVFVAKLNSTGSQLVYGATLGGNAILSSPKLVLDTRNDAFVTGSGGACCNSKTAIIGPLGGIDDFWVAEIIAGGNAIPWSAEIGGSGSDEAYGLAMDAQDKLYIAGYTDSSDFPFIAGSLQQPGPEWAFVDKLDPAQPAASSLIYTALVGNLDASNTNPFIQAQALAVSAQGCAYVGAWTYNPGSITSKWAFQPTAPAPPSVYIYQLNRSGSAIVNGTYLGGSAADYVFALATDPQGNVYAGGFTNSTDFPSTAYGKNGFAYYAKLNPEFAAISIVDFGGIAGQTNALSTDGAGGLWVGGGADDGFPTTADAFQPAYKGNYDAFLLHTSFAPLCSDKGEGAELCSIAADPTLAERIEFTGQAANVEQAVNTVLNIDDMAVFGEHAAQFDTWLPVAPGNHTASMVTQNFKGQQSEDTRAFTVASSSSCPLNPVVPSITICSPLNAAVIKGSVSVQAATNDSVSTTAVQLYVDGKFAATIQGQSGVFTYVLNLSPGVHRILAQGNDNYSRFFATSAVFRVEQ